MATLRLSSQVTTRGLAYITLNRSRLAVATQGDIPASRLTPTGQPCDVWEVDVAGLWIEKHGCSLVRKPDRPAGPNAHKSPRPGPNTWPRIMTPSTRLAVSAEPAFGVAVGVTDWPRWCGPGRRGVGIRIEPRPADIGITEAAYPANGWSAFEAMVLTQPVSPADFRMVIVEIVEIEIEKRRRGPVHVDLLTGNQLLGSARREMVMELGELVRQAAAEPFGHLRFPSGEMGITDGP